MQHSEANDLPAESSTKPKEEEAVLNDPTNEPSLTEQQMETNANLVNGTSSENHNPSTEHTENGPTPTTPTQASANTSSTISPTAMIVAETASGNVSEDKPLMNGVASKV